MRKVWNYHFVIVIVLLWLSLSAIGFVYRDTAYSSYTINAVKTPYFVLVLEGVRDGVYPWSTQEAPLWEQFENQYKGQQLSNSEPTDFPVKDTQQIAADSLTGDSQAINEAEGSQTEMVVEPVVTAPKEFTWVERDYFNDAVFIGDSRTAGLRDYGGLKETTFYATDGMGIYELWTKEFCEVEGELFTLEEALSTQTFKKVYFQLGINEMGRGTLEGFIEAYAQSVAKIRQLQPDAVIFIQGIMRVTKEKSESDPIFNNQGINLRNERIAQLADNQTVFYIDMNEAVCDEEGNLNASLTFDDLHLFGSEYGIWVEFLQQHGIIF